MPLVALLIVVLIGFLAMAVDWGQLHEERRHLQNTVDASALSGARELPALPGSPELAKATQMALQYMQLNGVAETPTITFDATYTDEDTTGYDTIHVTVNRSVASFFAQVIGTPTSVVGATATGISGSLGGTDACVLPLAALVNAPSAPGGGFALYPTEYVLKESAMDGWAGNRGGLALYGPGDDFFDALAGNCPEVVVRDGTTPPQTGNWGQRFFNDMLTRTSSEPRPWVPISDYAYQDAEGVWHTSSGQDWDDVSPRFVYVPVVDYNQYTACLGASCDVDILGFSLFFIKDLGCELDDGSVDSIVDGYGGSCSPGKGVVTGYYLAVASADIFGAWNPFGTSVQRLWQ